MLQGQQFHLGVTAQEICATDNVKDVGVKNSTVLSHLFIAQAYGHINSPLKGMDGSSLAYPYSHGFDFPDSAVFLQSAGHDGERGAPVQDRLVSLITPFNDDPENQICILRAAPLSLFRGPHIHPSSLQALEGQLSLRFLAF